MRNQKIFEIGLAVETISAYLLCCGLVDLGETLTTIKIAGMWNGSAKDLNKSLELLEEMKILKRILSSGGKNQAYELTDVADWHVLST
jgi:hypothetical protein